MYVPSETAISRNSDWTNVTAEVTREQFAAMSEAELAATLRRLYHYGVADEQDEEKEPEEIRLILKVVP